jgi:hypothetical protein
MASLLLPGSNEAILLILSRATRRRPADPQITHGGEGGVWLHRLLILYSGGVRKWPLNDYLPQISTAIHADHTGRHTHPTGVHADHTTSPNLSDRSR